MASLVVVTGVGQGSVFKLKPGVNRIGRGLENDFQIPDASISSRHCEITRSETALVVRDLNSTNGTYADGRMVTTDMPRRLEKLLRVGSVELELQIDVDGADAPVVRIPQLPMAEVPITSGTLPDGSESCANHQQVSATYKCTRCGQTLCDLCVRAVGRRGGATLIFCSLCSGQCQTHGSRRPAKRKKSFLKWLTSTLKLPLRW
jgi:hypothetical protein